MPSRKYLKELRELPAPSALLERWRSLSLLWSLVAGLNPAFEFVSLRVDDDGATRGTFDDGTPEGAYAWLYSSTDGATLYCGTSRDRFWEAYGPEIERAARKAISKLPKQLRDLVHPKHPKSMGWTFAMWASGLEDRWIDLTDLDKDCWKSAQFKDCHIFYAQDAMWIAEWVAEQFERPGTELTAEQILRSSPLSTAMAREFMPEFDQDMARQAALRCGYPLAQDLLA